MSVCILDIPIHCDLENHNNDIVLGVDIDELHVKCVQLAQMIDRVCVCVVVVVGEDMHDVCVFLRNKMST